MFRCSFNTLIKATKIENKNKKQSPIRTHITHCIYSQTLLRYELQNPTRQETIKETIYISENFKQVKEKSWKLDF